MSRAPLRAAAQLVSTLTLSAIAAGACAPAQVGRPDTGLPRNLPVPATRAERTAYRETSHHADVIAFLDTLRARCRRRS